VVPFEMTRHRLSSTRSRRVAPGQYGRPPDLAHQILDESDLGTIEEIRSGAGPAIIHILGNHQNMH
jgi:hypothetical protein